VDKDQQLFHRDDKIHLRWDIGVRVDDEFDIREVVDDCETTLPAAPAPAFTPKK